MSAETIAAYMKRCSSLKRLEFQISVQCAPVLKGIKISNIVTIKRGTWKRLRSVFKGSRIVCIPLFISKEKEVLLLYRPEQLKYYLQSKGIYEFLKSCGYESCDVVSVMLHLKRRYQEYAAGLAEFPHELGIILGYPLWDVEGFIQNQGKNFIFTGHWKVYKNKELAEYLFHQYDNARESAMEEIMNGCSLSQVAVW